MTESDHSADYVAVIRQAIEGKCRSDIGEVTLADAIVVQLLAAGFQIVPMDPRVRSLTAPMQRALPPPFDAGDFR